MGNNLYTTTILKAFDILDCFTDDCQENGISEISAAVGMPISSVHRIIQSLEYEGALIQNPENKKYSLGTKLLSLSEKCNRYARFKQTAIKYADQLSKLTEETVNLTTCTGDQITHIYIAPSHYVLRPNFPLNVSFPGYNTSVGRIFLSEMSDTTLKWIYENSKGDIHMTQQEFLSMRHRFKKDGYALDDGDFNVGLRCVAAPVKLSGGATVFAISISAPASRMNDARYVQARDLVVEYAALLSQQLQMLE